MVISMQETFAPCVLLINALTESRINEYYAYTFSFLNWSKIIGGYWNESIIFFISPSM